MGRLLTASHRLHETSRPTRRNSPRPRRDRDHIPELQW